MFAVDNSKLPTNLLRIVRPNLDSRAHKRVAGVALMVNKDVAVSVVVSVEEWAAAVVVVAVKFTSPTFVPHRHTSILANSVLTLIPSYLTQLDGKI